MRESSDQPAPKRKLRWRDSLSFRLFLIAIASVLVVEALIFIPSATNFRNNWLEDQIEAIQLGGALDNRLVERLASGQERLADTIASREDPSAFDAETRMRLRNIDVQLLRILEEMSAGRQDAVGELRAELSALTEALRQQGGQ